MTDLAWKLLLIAAVWVVLGLVYLAVCYVGSGEPKKIMEEEHE